MGFNSGFKGLNAVCLEFKHNGLYSNRLPHNRLITNTSGSEQCIFRWSQFSCHIDSSSHTTSSFISFPYYHISQRTCHLSTYLCICGPRGGAVGWGTALQVGKSRVWIPMASLYFFFDIILPTALWPWGRPSLQQKWVPGMFPGVKAAGT